MTRAAKTFPIDRQAVTADVVLFTIQDGQLKVLLIQRKHPPFQGAWALPGGFVRQDESIDEAALRELHEETNVSSVYLEQLATFGEPDRDPRERVITVAYYALINWERFRLKAQTDAQAAAWFPVKQLPALAFDHRQIITYAVERLRHKVNYTTVCFQLLPQQFTLTELQTAYEIILGTRLDKRNFRKKMCQLKLVKPLGRFKAVGVQRPARLYTFTELKVITLQEKGIIVPF